MARVYNFSAGPAVLPEEVLQEAADEMLDYRGTGMSVMEMSHRSKAYDTIIKEAEASLSSATSTTIRVAPLLSCACGSALSPTKLSARDCGNSKTAANTTTSTSPPKRGANPTGSWASTAHRRYPSPPDTARIPWGGCRHQRWLWYVNATGRTAALRPKHSGSSISQRTVATAKS